MTTPSDKRTTHDRYAAISSSIPTLALVGLLVLAGTGYVDFKTWFWPALLISFVPILLVGLAWWIDAFVNRFIRLLRLSWLQAVSVILPMMIGGAAIGAAFTWGMFRTYAGAEWIDTGIGVDKIGDVVITRVRMRAAGNMLSALLLALPFLAAVLIAFWLNAGLIAALKRILVSRTRAMTDNATLTPWDVVGYALLFATMIGAGLWLWAEAVALGRMS